MADADDDDAHFLTDWLGGNADRRLDKLARRVIHTDKYDEADYAAIYEEMTEFAASHDQLGSVSPTGGHLMGDAFMSFMKVKPEHRQPDEMRPTFLINHAVVGEMIGLNEWEKTRAMTRRGDDVGAAMAAISIEPELESLLDKLRKEQELAERLEREMLEAEGLQVQIDDIDAALAEMEGRHKPGCEDGDCTGGCQDEAPDYQKNRAMLNAQLDALRQAIGEGAQELEERLDGKGVLIRAMLRPALNRATDEAEATQTSGEAWGLERGHLTRLPADERLRLAKKFNNRRLREIANLFGGLHRLMLTEQMRKVDWAREEVFDVTIGDDLPRVLAGELVSLMDPLLELDFLRKLSEHSLLQYAMKGTDKVAKGGIICCEDGSGSMAGANEMWAKAVSLCFLHCAKRQKRSFYGIHFGSPGEYSTHDFRKPTDFVPDKIIEYAEIFFNSGTDFVTPLSVALGLLQEEFDKLGRTEGDIVFITDGICGVPPDWLEEFKREQERLSFKVYGVIIGGNPRSEPTNTICDGRVFTPADLREDGSEKLRSIFRDV